MARSTTLAVCLLFLAALSVLSDEPADAVPAVKSVAQLIDQARSSVSEEQLSAIQTLAERGEGAAEAVPALLKLLDADNPEVRGAAAESLAAIKVQPDKVLPALIERFSDMGFVMKYEPEMDSIPLFSIYGTSAAAFGEQAVEPLIEALDSDSQPVYLGAAIGLEAVGAPGAKATPQLIAMLEGDNIWTRRAAAGAIRGIGPGAAKATPALIKMLYDEDFHNQYWACRALGAIGPAAAVATKDLLNRLDEGVASVRRNAATALGNIGPDIGPDAAARLIQVVDQDPLAPVRQEAVIALGKLKPFAEQSVPALKKALANPNFTAPTHAARSLWLLTGDPNEALPQLLKSLDDLTYFQHAAEVLAEMGPEAAPAVDRLVEAMGERDPDDRVAAILALARIGTPVAKVKQAIEPALKDEAADVREAARVALEKLAADAS